MMDKLVSRSLVGLAAALWVAACITVNIYFPAPQVRAAAAEIVEETWGTATADAPSSSLEIHWFGPKAAHAGEGEPDVNVSTAAIRKLKASIKQRSAKLKPYLAAGNVGVAKDGRLVMRDLASVPLKEQATLRGLVAAENRDRESLYVEIAEANGYARERLDDIRRIFAETWRDKAAPGWPIQADDGSWSTK